MTVKFVLLPQVSGNGYYSYSSIDRQYGTQKTIDAIVDIGKSWFQNQGYLIGIGDMSFENGHVMTPHHSHRDGRCVDIRPLRLDHNGLPVNIASPDYDRNATSLLVSALIAHRNVGKILFNDAKAGKVTPWAGHDNHLHLHMVA
jgi:penicillin-insensitive murein DD-endopeptidase